MSQPTLSQGFADIRAVLPELPDPDLKAAAAARAYAKASDYAPFPSELLMWLAAWQGRFPSRLDHPRIVLFASDHAGVAADPEQTPATVAAILNGETPHSQLATDQDVDLRLYEMNLKTPTEAITTGAAMTEEECVAAVIYGMMAVETGLDAVTMAGFGQGTDLAAAVLAQILGHEKLAAALVPPDQQEAFTMAVERHKAAAADPLHLLRCVGGRDMAALMGAMIAARMAQTPLVMDGPSALLAAALLHRLDNRAAQHCFYVNRHAPQEASRLAAELGLMQVTTTENADADFSAHDPRDYGTASAALIPILRAATTIKIQ